MRWHLQRLIQVLNKKKDCLWNVYKKVYQYFQVFELGVLDILLNFRLFSEFHPAETSIFIIVN